MTGQIKVIYEDPNFLAVYKPARFLTHPAPKVNPKSQILNSKQKTLVDWLVEKYPEVKNVGDEPSVRPGIVHRLDRDTSGIILIARNQKYFEYLKNLFQTHKIKKNYLALVHGKLEPRKGVIVKPIKIKKGSVKRTIWRGKDEKEAITEYKLIKYYKYPRLSALNQRQSATFSLLKVSPKTGRTHQIRVHLASIGHPVVGDTLYGPKDNMLGLTRQFLHAESLEFSTAEGKRIKLEAELPEELKVVLN